jgi:hypothetical protein
VQIRKIAAGLACPGGRPKSWERLPAHDFICSRGSCPPVATQEHLAEKKKKQIQVPRHRRRAWQKANKRFLFIYLFYEEERPCDANVVLRNQTLELGQ